MDLRRSPGALRRSPMEPRAALTCRRSAGSPPGEIFGERLRLGISPGENVENVVFGSLRLVTAFLGLGWYHYTILIKVPKRGGSGLAIAICRFSYRLGVVPPLLR